MKKLVAIFALAMLLAPATPAIERVNKDMGYVSVTASESADVKPNVANITFSVETTDVDTKRASVRNNQITADVIKAIKEELSMDKKSMVQTKNYSIRPNYNVSEKNVADKTVRNYTALNTIQVKTSNPEKISPLIDLAVKNKVSKVGEVFFTTENTDDLSIQLTDSAVKKARVLANATAAAAGKKVSGVKSIRVNVYNQGSNCTRMYDSAGKGLASSPTPIESGKVKINANVDAEFYVK